MFWNIAYFGIIISLLVKYNEIGQLRFLSKNQLWTLLFNELFAILKLYFHIISLVRNDRNSFYKENHCCLHDINNVDCLPEIVIKEEKEEEL